MNKSTYQIENGSKLRSFIEYQSLTQQSKAYLLNKTDQNNRKETFETDSKDDGDNISIIGYIQQLDEIADKNKISDMFSEALGVVNKSKDLKGVVLQQK